MEILTGSTALLKIAHTSVSIDEHDFRNTACAVFVECLLIWVQQVCERELLFREIPSGRLGGLTQVNADQHQAIAF
jgi:hypothetical protein